MKKKIAILGSCVSRDAFNSYFVPNYKNFFEVVISAQRTSMISILQNPVSINNDLIKIFPETKQNVASTHFISMDLNKSFINELIEKDVDYLIIDNYLEIRMGILYFNNHIITNNFWDLPKTAFYNDLDDKFIFRIIDFPNEYFQLWSKYCDLFFNLLNNKCPKVKVILNKGRAIDKVICEDGSIYVDSEFTEGAQIINNFLDKLDSYIYDNFDVMCIDFDFENTFINENHIWGLDPVHYSENYYPSLINNIFSLIDENNSDDFSQEAPNFDEKRFEEDRIKLNMESKLFVSNLKIIKLKDEIFRINRSINSINEELTSIQNYPGNDSNISNLNLLNIYSCCRVDFKNFGSKYNNVKILKNYDAQSKVDYPQWFKSNEGQGFIFESESGCADLRIECINDGILKIWLRGPDIRDKNNNKFPIFIDYVDFLINGRSCIDDSKLVFHDQPFLFEKEVHHSETLDIHIEWLPFNNSSVIE